MKNKKQKTLTESFGDLHGLMVWLNDETHHESAKMLENLPVFGDTEPTNPPKEVLSWDRNQFLVKGVDEYELVIRTAHGECRCDRELGEFTIEKYGSESFGIVSGDYRRDHATGLNVDAVNETGNILFGSSQEWAKYTLDDEYCECVVDVLAREFEEDYRIVDSVIDIRNEFLNKKKGGKNGKKL